MYFAPKCLHWKPYTGPRSPSLLCPSPRFSKNSLLPFPSQILMPFAESSLESVEPWMNHSSSSSMPRQNVRFVVRRGRVLSARENRREGGAKMDSVPVPVRSGRVSPVSRTLRMSSRYWYSSCLHADALFGTGELILADVSRTEELEGSDGGSGKPSAIQRNASLTRPVTCDSRLVTSSQEHTYWPRITR